MRVQETTIRDVEFVEAALEHIEQATAAFNNRAIGATAEVALRGLQLWLDSITDAALDSNVPAYA